MQNLEVILTIWWSVVTAVAIVVELSTVALVSIWFAIGGACALLVNLMHGPALLQFIVFFAVSILSLVLFLPMVKKRMKTANGEPILKNNVDRYIGKIANVTEPIDNITGSGRVMYSGISWAAKSSDDSVKVPDGQAKILVVEGSKLIVEPFHPQEGD